MLVLRPINEADLAALKDIAVASGHGFTSLPNNEEQLASKIHRTQSALAKEVLSNGDEGYLFVLEDTETGEIVGTTGIEASVGLTTPIYHYHLGKTVHHSRALGIYNTVDTLTMCNDYTGVSEICTLFLKESHRKGLTGRFLSRSRFLFMAEHPNRFSDKIIAEMRGVSDEKGHSPFWEWLQKHFFSIDFPTADHLMGLGNKVFICELMPKFPIYANLLSAEAQAVIGHVHKNTLPALKLLQKEGFEHRGYVDLFDAGPTVEADLEHIRSIQMSKRAQVCIENTQSDHTMAISNSELGDFRATFTHEARFCEKTNELKVSPQVAAGLQVKAGDWVRFFSLTHI